MSERRKITVVGAGNVGATCAQVLAQRDYADIVLVDIKEGLPQGKALDINQMGAVLGYEPTVTGSNDYGPTAGSDVVVITAGLPRSPGMSRDDLVTTNEKIVKDVTEKVADKSPDAIRADKRLLNDAVAVDAAAGLMAESVEQEKLIGAPNQVEAIMSNLQKRAANYKD